MRPVQESRSPPAGMAHASWRGMESAAVMANDGRNAPTQKIGSMSPLLADAVLADADPSVEKPNAGMLVPLPPPPALPSPAERSRPQPAAKSGSITPWLLGIAVCLLLLGASILVGYIAG